MDAPAALLGKDLGRMVMYKNPARECVQQGKCVLRGILIMTMKWSVSCGVVIAAMAVSAMAARDEGKEESGESRAVPTVKYVVASPRAYLTSAARQGATDRERGYWQLKISCWLFGGGSLGGPRAHLKAQLLDEGDVSHGPCRMDN